VATLFVVFIATLICSDERCADEHELVTGDLAALVDEACACGCTLVLLAVAEWEPAALPALV
jgi:hypothetical protein